MEDWDWVPGLFQLRNLLESLNNQWCQISVAWYFEMVSKGELNLILSLKSLYTSIWPNFILIGLDLEFKRNNQKCNSYYEAMSGDVTDFEICGFHENTKI